MKTSKNLYDAITDIREDYVEEAEAPKKAGFPVWARWTAAAAAGLLVLAIPLAKHPAVPESPGDTDNPLLEQTLPEVPREERKTGKIRLSDRSRHVTARYTDKTPPAASEDCLVFFSEEELFTYFDLAIFSGTVTDLYNVELSFNGQKTYRGIAEIRVQKVWQGDCGETVTMLLPGPIGVAFSGDDVVSRLEVGMDGLFMPILYDEGSLHEENGATLALQDLAQCGLADGCRWEFLQTDGGILYAEEAYPGLKNPENLEDVANYVEEMLAKVTEIDP